MTKTFKPTTAQIQAAQNLMLAMAHQDLVEPIVKAYQRGILERNQWKICPTMAEPGGENEIIKDPENAYLMNDADSARYFQYCHEAQIASGLKVSKPEHCPLLEARSLVVDARRALVKSMERETGMTWELLMNNFSKLPRYIDLTLKLLAPFVGTGQEVIDRVMSEG